MKMNIQLEREELESIKISLDSSVTYWKTAADKEDEPRHKIRFLELYAKYSSLYEKIKSYLKYNG